MEFAGVPEARLEQTDTGVVVDGPGWFIYNVGEASWETIAGSGGGTWLSFEAENAPNEQAGIGIHVLWPGESNGFYHAENDQEGFLVLSGECIAIVEGEERRLRQWDYLHCPPGTHHITVGAGDGPCAILMFGARSAEKRYRYPVDPVAARHGASVERETDSPREAYAHMPREITRVRAPFPPEPGC